METKIRGGEKWKTKKKGETNEKRNYDEKNWLKL